LESSHTNKSGVSPALRVSSSPTVSLMNLVAPTPSPANTIPNQSQTKTTTKKETRTPASTTPLSPRENDLTLFPPSQTIGESLTSLASTTAAQLEQVWDVVGYTPEERASQISDLLLDMRRLCEAKVAEEKSVEEQFRRTIAEAREEILVTSKALNADFDHKILEDCGQTLQDELSTVEETLECLRNVAAEATDDLTDCREKLITMYEALGSKVPKTWLDITSDLTHSRRNDFHQQVKETGEVVATRTNAVLQLLYDCQHLMNELRINDTDDQMTDFDKKIMSSLIHSEDGKVTIRSTKESANSTGISSSTLDALTNRVTELSKEKRRRKAMLSEMGAEIAVLWEKLRVPEDVQRTFTISVTGLGMDTILKGQNELQRLRDLKTKMIGKLILEARDTIKALWDETNATDEQRLSFKAGQISDKDLFTDSLLSQHEDYIASLNARLNLMRPILKIIEKREDILKERYEIEQLQKDPDRLQQRGAALTKQLMKEEKMTRRIKKDLPKYTDALTKKLRDWESENGDPFIFNGESYLSTMKRQSDDWKNYKENAVQMKLKKKQEEKASENEVNGTHYKPLPGRKKTIPTSQPSGRSRPLSEIPNHDNRNRSRTLSRSRAASRSRVPSRSRGASVRRRESAMTS